MWYFVYFSIFLVLMLVAYFTVCFFVDLPSHLKSKKQREQDLSNRALDISYDRFNGSAISLLRQHSKKDNTKIHEVVETLIDFKGYSSEDDAKLFALIVNLLGNGRVLPNTLSLLRKYSDAVSKEVFMKDFRDAVRTVFSVSLDHH